MIEVAAIFTAIIVAPMIVALPPYLYQTHKDRKDREAQKIVDRLKGNANSGETYFKGFS